MGLLDFWRKPRFDPDTLSSIWVMACRDESPVLTAFSIAFRLGNGITPDQVMELVRGRRELFRIGLTPKQSRAWKERYREALHDDGAKAKPADEPKKTDGKGEDKDGAEKPEEKQPPGLPDWLRAFDDEVPKEDQDRVRAWLGDPSITSSPQALERFLDQGFVIDENVVRSQFRLEPGLDAEPSDLPTVNWGLEHIERLRRGRAETRQSVVALTTGIGGVAIGALVALTAPMLTTLYQGRPVDNNRATIDHQTFINGYGTLGAAVASARRAPEGDGKALEGALTDIEKASIAIQPLIWDEGARKALAERREAVLGGCGSPSPACEQALDRLQSFIDGPLADIVVGR